MPPKSKAFSKSDAASAKSKSKARAKAKATGDASGKSSPCTDSAEPKKEAEKPHEVAKPEPAGSGLQAARSLQEQKPQGATEENNEQGKASLEKTQEKTQLGATDSSPQPDDVKQGDSKQEESKEQGSPEAASGSATHDSQAPTRLTVDEKTTRLIQVPDPWDLVADSDAAERIADEKWDSVLELDELESTPSHESIASHLLSKGATVDQLLKAQGELELRVVSLDLTESQVEQVSDLPALWLRNLVLSGSPVSSLDGISKLFPKLLSIDLSFVDIPSIVGGWDALAACASLRTLLGEGSCVATFEDMPVMKALESLELLENDVEEVEELKTLAAKCPNLKRLDLRENPVVSESGYAKAVKKHLPGLSWHNNQSLKKQTAKAAALGKVAIAVNADVAAVDGLYKNESCSCLEGNPCIDPATCVDWANREVVAKEARRKKGLRGPAGEFI